MSECEVATTLLKYQMEGCWTENIFLISKSVWSFHNPWTDKYCIYIIFIINYIRWRLENTVGYHPGLPWYTRWPGHCSGSRDQSQATFSTQFSFHIYQLHGYSNWIVTLLSLCIQLNSVYCYGMAVKNVYEVVNRDFLLIYKRVHTHWFQDPDLM